MALSVDPPEVSLPWVQSKGFTFPMASDPEQGVIKAWGLTNPDVPELALHAVYLIDRDGKVFYRKIARRRAYPPEFLDAVDYFSGDWPRTPKPARTPQPKSP